MAARGLGGLVFLLLATSCGSDHDSASALAGDFSRHHRVWVFHGSEPVEVEVDDRLTLTVVDDRSLGFSLQLFALDGHECELLGVARREGAFFSYREPGERPSCELRFQAGDNTITVTDLESRCSLARCGRAGFIERETFLRIADAG